MIRNYKWRKCRDEESNYGSDKFNNDDSDGSLWYEGGNEYKYSNAYDNSNSDTGANSNGNARADSDTNANTVPNIKTSRGKHRSYGCVRGV